MAKVVYCRDVGFGCDFIARAITEEELLRQVARHLRQTHRSDLESPAEWERVRAVIRDEARYGDE